MRRKLVAGNWKMHGSLSRNGELLGQLAAHAGEMACEMLVCPPFPYLAQAQLLLAGSGIGLGAQNLSEHPVGAFTGEVSADMLADFGCRHVLVGHSERRSLFAESDVLVAAKFEAARRAGLVPVLCVGETLAEREAGLTGEVVSRQLLAVLQRTGVAAMRDALVAYEPVWAIGTGRTATPAQAQEVHAAIRSLVAGYDADVAGGLRILYGGSVKPQNALELFGQPDIDGGLIGGAALVAEDFLAICRAAN
ncbi:triose-phosphate isomerase [Azonexus hydrophilus]|uniref:Triosephosphate isomerase n=1 Tax=Azonexus hydrophilus TaxID=418702 RepID=A0A1R1I4W5_9RHOO|nr:triose-phosphate isomerase [Azonexus hydrophilus]OMG53786.1 triose-phosphate isomerase [Azonexus hydrophilus]